MTWETIFQITERRNYIRIETSPIVHEFSEAKKEIERIETIERIKNFQTLALLLFPPRYFEILVVEISSKQVFLAVAVAIQRLRLDAICDRVSTGKHFRADYVGGREHPFATRAKASLLERLEKGGDDIF